MLQGLIDVQRYFFCTCPTAGDPSKREGRALCKENGNRALLARALRQRGTLAANTYDLSTAAEYTLEALKIAHEIRDLNSIGACYLNLGIYMRRAGRFETALACTKASLEWYAMDGYSESYAHAMNAMADQQLKSGNWREALQACRDAQRILETIQPDTERRAINSADYACILMNEVTVPFI